MKRYGNLIDKITDIDNIKLAHTNASKGKKWYKEVQMVNEDMDKYCYEIKRLLESGEYRTSEYEHFTKVDKGKKREIYKLPYYPDRIVHHAIMQVLEPIWKKTFIKNTYQSIKGRGPHKCKRDIERVIKRSNVKLYYTKIDVIKFYPSINNDIMKGIVRKKIKCKATLEILDEIIDSSKGIPIGNYISQYLGNLYLTYLDHEVKEKYGLDGYFRYCDDIVLVSKDKHRLKRSQVKVIKSLAKLKLSVKLNSNSVSTEESLLDYVGYQYAITHTLLRRSIADSFRLKARKGKIVESYYGWLKHCNGYNLWTKYKGE